MPGLWIMFGAIALVIIAQLLALKMEMFDWVSEKTMKVFFFLKEDEDAATRRAFFEDAKVMAANQGLYNGFLAAGLVWALARAWRGDVDGYVSTSVFFLICIFIAGLYGTFATPASRLFKLPVLAQSVTSGFALLSIYLYFGISG